MFLRRRLASAVIATLTAFGAVAIGQPAPAFAAPTGNPIISGDHPDPTIELFNGAYYIYTTSSGGGTDLGGRYFYAWRSYDLKNWHNAGVVLDRATVSWASGDGRTWAPDMIARNGKFYFYSAIGTQISVAECDGPAGPCRDRGSPLVTGKLHAGVEAIDPMVFIDDNGQAYLYFAGSAGGGTMGIYKLQANMMNLDGAVIVQRPTNLTEAPFVFKRNGLYYLQYSNGAYNNDTYNVQYSTGSSPTGPWTYRGSVMRSMNGYVGTGHHAVLQYPGTDDWYVVYHRYQNNSFAKRYTAIDRMYFNGDGTIQQMNLTAGGPEERRAPGTPVTTPMAPPQPIEGPGSKCVDVAGNDIGGNGAAVQLWDCIPNAKDQLWTWNGSTLRTLGRCLDVAGNSTATGAKLQLWDCNGAGGQNWEMWYEGVLRNPQSAKCIDSPGGSTANGARMQLWDCNLGAGAQAFQIGFNKNNGAPRPVNIIGPGSKCVDIEADDVGANLMAAQLWSCLAGASDQYYAWVGTSLTTMGKCLDIADNGTANGLQVRLYDCNGVGGQQWQQQADGSLRNPQSGRCLDAIGGATINGTRLQIADCNGGAAQKFRVG